MKAPLQPAVVMGLSYHNTQRTQFAIPENFRTLAGIMSTHTHNHDIDYKSAFTVETLPGSQVKIVGELPFAELEHERASAIKKLGKNLKIDGFRPGHIPETVLVKHLGEMAVVYEMAERAIAHHYAHIVEAHDLAVIGYPSIEITKIAAGNPLGFTATVAILPTVTLPDYKALAKEVNTKKESSDVTDEEVTTQINDILRQKMAYDRLQAKAAAKTEVTTNDDTTTESEAAKTKENADTIETEEDFKKLPVPELTDELVATLGQPGQFTSVADFKAKVREHLEIEKKRDVEAKHRANITDTIIAGTAIELPKILIESELNQMFAQMDEDLTRANLNMDDYLSHIKKTKDDLRTEWTPAAEKRAQLQLVLNEIAKIEKITPDEQQLNDQVGQLLAQYKDADERRVRVYVASVMTNEAVMQLLEKA
jgi:trigger factor